MLSKNNPFDCFDAIYCINLDRRTDQWEAVQREFDKIGIRERVVRFSAIETLENGHLGCLLSHLSIYEIAQKKKYKNILVFEDDIIFISDLSVLFRTLNDIIDQDFDLLYLGGGFGPVSRLTQFSRTWYKAQGIWLMHSYGSSSTMRSKFIKNVEIQGGPREIIRKYMHFDKWIACILSKEMDCFLPKKMFFAQKNNFSDTDGYFKKWNSNNFIMFSLDLISRSRILQFIQKLALYFYRPF